MEETNTVVKELDENTSTEDILKQSPDAQEEAKTSSEATTDKGTSDATGEVEKTQETEAGAEVEKSEEEKEEDALLQSKKPVPYQRLAQKIKQCNELKNENEQFKQEREELFSDPDVLRVVLSKQGYNEQQVGQQLQKMGFEAKPEGKETKPDPKQALKDLVKDLDLSTTEGWLEANYRISQKTAAEVAQQNIQKYDSEKSNQSRNEKIISQLENEAKKLCETTYKIPFGESGKDEKNPATAMGKIFSYAERNPDKIPNVWGLGHTALLKLAMSEEGFKLGEQKGKEEEKNRLKKLKSAAIESEDVTTGKDEGPNENWSTGRIQEYMKKHPEWKP